jgi:septal ring factor EnvC (AmiA/AmiB activator)
MRTLFNRVLLIAALSIPACAIAQDDDMPQLPEGRLQEIKAQKTAFLTQRMDLTPEEAQKFWPVYNQFDKEIEANRKDMREIRKEMKETGTSDAEASKSLDRMLAALQKELDIRKQYTGEFKKVIGASKTLRMFKAEKDFNRELVKRIRDRVDERRDGHPGERRRERP